MWEKMCDYCLDVSKYFLTAVLVTSLMTDLGEIRWLLYSLSVVLGLVFVGAAAYCHNRSKNTKAQKRSKYRKYNNKNRSK